MYELPTSIQIEDTNYNISKSGDFRVILDCFSVLNDIELDEQYRIVAALIIFYEDINCEEDIYTIFGYRNLEKVIKEMFNFINCNQVSLGMKTNYNLIDWDDDSQIICAAVNNVSHKEIRSESYIHWWTFMGYYCSIGESILSTVVGIRNKLLQGKKLEKWESEYRSKNPQYFCWNYKPVSQKQREKQILSSWNSSS